MPTTSHSSTTGANNMLTIFALCRKDDWNTLLVKVREDPQIATTPMIMDNHISTTILHQAITSKANTDARAKVIQTILDMAPEAATIKNGYGSLPLHVISQRNTKMDSQTKEQLIFALVKVYPEALVQEGGVGKRTPLHIAFTDYISPHLARMMITAGKAATSKKDKKGWLPIHVAVSRHCSPEKLAMLLEANPSSLHAVTSKGETLLALAKSSATKSHPNFRLIAELEEKMIPGHARETKKEESNMNHGSMRSPPPQQDHHQKQKQKEQTRSRYTPRNHVTRKRKAEAADLLLHFSRHEQQIPEHVQPQPLWHHHHHYLQKPLPPVYYHGPARVNFAPVYPAKQEPMMKQGAMTVKHDAVHQPQFSVQEQQEYMNRFAGYYPSQPMYYANPTVGETAQV